MKSPTLFTLMLVAACASEPSEDTNTRVVALEGATTAADQAAYVVGETLTVTWSGLPGNATDWVAISPAGSDPMSVVRWRYIGGQTAGSYTFSFLFAEGTYVARTYLEDGYTIAAESEPFTFTNSSTLTPASPNFTKGQTIVLNWSNIPDNAGDWIAIAPAGSDVGTISRWFYTNGQRNGTRAVASQPDGSYVARLFMDDGYVLIAETSFTVGGDATVTTDRTIYSPMLPITVTWSGLPGMPNDWIGIAPAGSDPATVTAWSYIGGQAAGEHAFYIGTPGTYVARAFPTDTYNIAGESAPFTVGIQCATSTANGHLVIRNAADVAAAATLTTISGNFTIDPDAAGLEVDLPCLESANVIQLGNSAFAPAAIRLARLERLNGALKIDDATPIFEAHNLVSIAGNAELRTTTNTDGLVSLATVGGTLTVVAPEVELRSLTSASSFVSVGPSAMTRLVAPKLVSVPTALTIQNHAQLPQCYADNLLAQLAAAPTTVTISGLGTGTCP